MIYELKIGWTQSIFLTIVVKIRDMNQHESNRLLVGVNNYRKKKYEAQNFYLPFNRECHPIQITHRNLCINIQTFSIALFSVNHTERIPRG